MATSGQQIVSSDMKNFSNSSASCGDQLTSMIPMKPVSDGDDDIINIDYDDEDDGDDGGGIDGSCDDDVNNSLKKPEHDDFPKYDKSDDTDDNVRNDLKNSSLLTEKELKLFEFMFEADDDGKFGCEIKQNEIKPCIDHQMISSSSSSSSSATVRVPKNINEHQNSNSISSEINIFIKNNHNHNNGDEDRTDDTSEQLARNVDNIDNQQQRQQLQQTFSLKLDLIGSDMDDTSDLNQKKFKTKKFYESDDTLITQIFSQTITSAGVTPTEESESSYFDAGHDQTDEGNVKNISAGEKTSASKEASKIEETVENDVKQSSTVIDNKLDNADDLDDDDNGDVDDSLNVNTSKLCNTQRPSIVVDFYDDNDNDDDDDDGPSEQFYTEPITPKQIKSYFDTTIEDDFDDDVIIVDQRNSSPLNKEQLHSSANENELKNVSSFNNIENQSDVNSLAIDKTTASSAANVPSDDIGGGVDSNPCVNVHSAIERLESESTKITTMKTKTSATTTTTRKLLSGIKKLESSNVEKIDKAENLGKIDNKIVDKMSTTLSSAVTTTSTVTATTENNVEKITKKKSSETTGGKKKSKKTKKSDPEKENISVLNNGCYIEIMMTTDNKIMRNDLLLAGSEQHQQILSSLSSSSSSSSSSLSKKIHTNGNLNENNCECVTIPSSIYNDDDLSNINVKSLKKSYLTEYEKNLEKQNKNSSKARIFIGDVSVKYLCRSYGDLTFLNDDNFKIIHRAKSFGDLRKYEHLPIHTGVSVRALRDSYCHLVGLGVTQNSNTQMHVKKKKYKRYPTATALSYNGIKQFDMKSSFSKFDALQKKNILNVRSGDSGKTQDKSDGSTDLEKKCRACDKAVFQMEQIKAERNIWHKNCFRCTECSKQLNVDTYQSHESLLYCRPHFKALFSPKAVENNDAPTRRKHELIIRENQPIELPPDVVRASDKPDLGLEELHQLNVRSRFNVFEHGNEEKCEIETRSPGNVTRSQSILSKLAKFQAKGMNVGVTDDSLNGVPFEASSSDDDDDAENQDVDHDGNDNPKTDSDDKIVRSNKKRMQKERPMSFREMNEMKTRFESGHLMSKEERREERKQEIQNIRSRLFMGKQAKIKEMYQQAVLESEQGITSVGKKPDIDIGQKAKSIKEKFEKGEIFIRNRGDDDDDDTAHEYPRSHEEDLSVFEQGISKNSRSIFMELDASASKTAQTPITTLPSPRTPEFRNQKPLFAEDIIKSDTRVDDVKIETSEISSKFKFFETYKPSESGKKQFRITPPREGVVKMPSPERESDIYRDPDVIRSGEDHEGTAIAEQSHTATKMLSIFRQMEEKREPTIEGPKPLKCFTPPPDEGRRLLTKHENSAENSCSDEEYEDQDDDEEDDEEDEENNPNYVRSSDKYEDEFLKQAQTAARAKQLRAKFERWESNEIKREQNDSSINLYDQNNEESQIESAKSLRAKFELMRDKSNSSEARQPVKVNRFV